MSLSCVVVNQGNTSTKWGVFREGVLVETYRTFSREEEHNLIQKLNGYQIPSFGISVCDREKQQHLFGNLQNFHRVELNDFPAHEYEEGKPGEDRLANVAGARYLFPEASTLIIDFGTCITYTLEQEGKLIGGSISPGVQTRFKSMHAFTGNLPEVSFEKPKQAHSVTTEDAMRSGVYYGIVGELKEFIRLALDKQAELNLVFTGSDAMHFAEPLEYRIFVEENLTLFGIYALAQRISFSR